MPHDPYRSPFDGLIDDISSGARARQHIRCAGCGMRASSPTWQWTRDFTDGHVLDGAPPELCGPLELVFGEESRWIDEPTNE